MPKHKSTLMDRFLAKVQKTETCWWWKPSKETKNYGKFWNETRQEDAHRVAYRMFVGGDHNLELRVQQCVLLCLVL